MSSSFLNTMKINNIQRELNNLETTVANLQIDGAPVIAGNVDMNSHSIVECTSISSADGHTLQIAGGVPQYDGVQLVSIGANCQFGGNSFYNLGTVGTNNVEFSANGSQILTTNTDDNLVFNSDIVLTSANANQYGAFVNTANADLNMDSHNITDVDDITATTVTIGSSVISEVSGNLQAYGKPFVYQNQNIDMGGNSILSCGTAQVAHLQVYNGQTLEAKTGDATTLTYTDGTTAQEILTDTNYSTYISAYTNRTHTYAGTVPDPPFGGVVYTDSQPMATPTIVNSALITGSIQYASYPSCIKFEAFVTWVYNSSEEQIFLTVMPESVSVTNIYGTGITGITFSVQDGVIFYTATFYTPNVGYNICYEFNTF